MRQELEAPVFKQVVYSNGLGGWIMSPQGMMAMTPAVLKQIQGEVFRVLLHLATCEGCAINATGENTVELTGKNGESARLELDPRTGLPLKLWYDGNTVNEYSAWTDANGLRAPSHWTITREGAKFAEANVLGYQVNTGLTDQELSKRP
jgi:hypothetical protein